MNAAGPFPDKPSLRVSALMLARGDRVLFEGLSFEAGAGDYVELRGANGSGKTSLLRAIAGFLRPRVGQIEVGGHEERALALHYIHYNFARPQKALNGTPAMAAGLTDRVWSVDDIIALLDAAEKKAAA